MNSKAKNRQPTMTKYFTYIIFTILLLNQKALPQYSNNPKSCYSDKPFKKEKVFTKMLHNPYFKGGNDSLLNFIMDNIGFQKIAGTLSQNQRIYNDTARIRFIVSKNGRLSDLSVSLTKNKILASEIVRVIKKSACQWVAGGTERLLNGWLQFDIYYLIDRRYNELTTKIKIKEYDFLTDN
jgi:hypothetical protein